MRAMEPAVTPAIIPTAPSMLIHAKLTHERRRAARAPRIQSASRRGSVVEAGAQQASWQVLDSVAEVPAGASESGCSGEMDHLIEGSARAASAWHQPARRLEDRIARLARCMAAFDEEHQARQDGESLGHAARTEPAAPTAFVRIRPQPRRQPRWLDTSDTLPRAGFSRYPEVWIQGRQKTRTVP